MKTWTKRFIALLCCVVMTISSISVHGLQSVEAAGTVDVYDFNGTDFSTALLSGEGSGPLKAAALATKLTDTSSVPTGFTGGVYGGGNTKDYASVPVDFAKPIDLSKVTSIKVRMYINGPSPSTDKLRILSEDSTDDKATYDELLYATYGSAQTWCDIDITGILKSGKLAKDENGYLDRFILAYRIYGDTTICYFDSIIIEGEDYFVDGTTDEPDEPIQPDEPVELTDITISDFVDASGNQMQERAYAHTEELVDVFHLKEHTSMDNKMLSMKIKYTYGDYKTRLGVAGSAVYKGLYVYPHTSGTYLFIVAAPQYSGVAQYTACEIAAAKAGISSFVDKEFLLQLSFEFSDADSNNKADLKLGVYINGNLYNNQKFTISGVNMDYFGNYMDLYREDAASVITIASATSDSVTESQKLTIADFVDTSGNQMQAKDYPWITGGVDDFYLQNHANFDNKELYLRLKYQYGGDETRIHLAGTTLYSGLMIYTNKEGTYLFIVASQAYAGTDNFQAIEISATKAGVASFVDKEFLLQLNFTFDEADSNNKTDLKLGIYINGKLYNNQIQKISNCNITKFGNHMCLYRANAKSVITVGDVNVKPVAYDFNGTDFDTTLYDSEGSDVLKPGNLATKVADTSTVPVGHENGVYAGNSDNYVSVPVSFSKAIDLSRVMSVKLRMYVPTELVGKNSRVRIFTNEVVGNATYSDAAYTDMQGTYGEWCELDITDLLKSSQVAKDANGNLGRFIIGFRTYGTGICYFDSIIIDGVDYFVSEEGTFRDVTIATYSNNSAFNAEKNAWDIYPVPKNPTGVPGTENETTFEVSYEINGTKYTGAFYRADNTKGLYFSIPATQLSSSANGDIVTIKAGEYSPNGVTAGIRITEDYSIYFHNGAVTEYEGEEVCEADNGVYTVGEGENIMIDGETVAAGTEYTKSGVHLLTFEKDGCTYAKHILIYHYGDMDDDGKLNAKDLVVMKKHLAKQRDVSKAGVLAADMDVDNKATTKDAALLRKRLITDSGALVLCPTDGRIVAHADAVADKFVSDYYVGIADEFGTEPIACGRNVTLLKWISFEDATSYTVKLATKADMSDAISYESDDCTLELMNLYVDKDYYWTVMAGDYVSEVQTFHTQATIRSLTIGGVDNARDGGGWYTLDGKYVKQGMFYRGAKIDNITAEGKDIMLNQLGIKTDLDLRNTGEEQAGTISPLGAGVQYFNWGGPYYWDDTRGINAEEYQEALRNEIRTFANADNYPIYVHCSIGRDRTGTLIFLINALLGVGEQDLYMDYEFSTLSLTRDEYGSGKWMTGVFKTMYDNVKAYAPNGTMAEATEAFMLSIGITQGEIDSIREILLEK